MHDTITTLTHAWQEAGMGQAPYRCTGHTDTGSVTTTCDYCGAGLRHVFFVQDSQGHSFKVGMDCIDRAGDVRVTTEAKRLKAKADRQKRQAKAQAAWQARLAAQQAELDRQRLANGGKTDSELEIEREAAVVAAELERVNGWLLDALQIRERCNGKWEGLDQLRQDKITDMSPRFIGIVRDIYCRAIGGRAGSKAFAAAEDQFWCQMEAVGYEPK